MLISMLKTTLIWHLFASLSSSLQVSPNSPCSLECMDNTNGDPSDPNNSNTIGKDLTCQDSDFSTTPVGQKFQACLNCLQMSGYETAEESDQAWYIYNLRYAVDYCLWGYPDNAPTLAGPCLIDTSCGHYSTALESSITSPNKNTTFDYCSADGSTFSDGNVNLCVECLAITTNHSYLGNFVTALEAGCMQKPGGGTLIGLSGTLFNSSTVAITTPIVPTTSLAIPSGSPGLSLGSIVGVVVGCIVAILIFTGMSIIYLKKKQRRHFLESHYDERFGAPDISAPNPGAYMDRQSQNGANQTLEPWG